MTNIQEIELAWTPTESAEAHNQGWGLFGTNRDPETEQEMVNGKPYGHRPFELQRVDDVEVFANDDEVHAFVRKAAEYGNPLANRALAFLQAYSPIEYAAVKAGN